MRPSQPAPSSWSTNRPTIRPRAQARVSPGGVRRAASTSAGLTSVRSRPACSSRSARLRVGSMSAYCRSTRASFGSSQDSPSRARKDSSSSRFAAQSSRSAVARQSTRRSSSTRCQASSSASSSVPRSSRPRQASSQACWMSSAVAARPSRRATVRVRSGSWEIARKASTGRSGRRSGARSASTSRTARAAVPTFSQPATWAWLASPVITCSRRHRRRSACGSSRVLMIGRCTVVSRATSVSKKSGRWPSWNPAAWPAWPIPTRPAPITTVRETRKPVRSRTIRSNGTARATR
ncbi:hypothetical protein SDC9_110955 [bioreactor metagenome]|uniref:Uncharacterized protein n=1 Tax=bioreactor metagenome TaxID=1076179 RepID=A0A645BF41_9ZZZZ